MQVDSPNTGPRSPDDPAVWRPEDDQSDLVCYCMRVREATLRRAIDGGADTVAALGERTRAGTGCGTCRSDLIRLIREQTEDPDADRCDAPTDY